MESQFLCHWYDSTWEKIHRESRNKTLVCRSQGRHLTTRPMKRPPLLIDACITHSCNLHYSFMQPPLLIHACITTAVQCCSHNNHCDALPVSRHDFTCNKKSISSNDPHLSNTCGPLLHNWPSRRLGCFKQPWPWMSLLVTMNTKYDLKHRTEHQNLKGFFFFLVIPLYIFRLFNSHQVETFSPKQQPWHSEQLWDSTKSNYSQHIKVLLD